MTFYFIQTGFSENTLQRVSLLERACQRRGIDSVALESGSVDRLELPTLNPGDALYNVTRGGLRLEEFLWRPGVATFYANDLAPRGIQDTTRWLAAHTSAGLSQPRTIVHPTANRELLSKYVAELGGFPIVVKIADSTLGNGVIRADSWPALHSLVDYLVAQGTDFIIREYIEGPGSARLMVIGKRVVGSLGYDNPQNDFRTNTVGACVPRVTQLDPSVEALAVSAVRSAGMDLGGVDVVFGVTGIAYLLETNMPCGFATFPKLGIDVPGMMVDYLLAKAHAHTASLG